MSQYPLNPITQAVNFRIDAEGVHIHCIIEVTDENKYPFEKMAALARYIKTDIEEARVVFDNSEVEEEADDIL